MKQNFIIITILICTFICAFTKDVNAQTSMSDITELDNAIREASTYLNERVTRGDKVVIVNVSRNFPMLAEYIIENLIENAVNDRSFDVIDRAQLDAVRAELQFQTSGEVSDESVRSVGRILGARTIITVTVSQVATMYRFSIRALDVESAEIRGQVSRNISSGESVDFLAAQPAPPPPVSAQPSATSRPTQTVAATQQQTTQTQSRQAARLPGRFPQASERLLTDSDLRNMNKRDLRIMRNEIFARHGYIFQTDDMNRHFRNQNWYRPRLNDVNHLLTEIEKQNVTIIRRYE